MIPSRKKIDVIHKPSKSLITSDPFYGGALNTFGCLSPDDWRDPDNGMARVFVRQFFHPHFADGLIPVYSWQAFYDDDLAAIFSSSSSSQTPDDDAAAKKIPRLPPPPLLSSFIDPTSSTSSALTSPTTSPCLKLKNISIEPGFNMDSLSIGHMLAF